MKAAAAWDISTGSSSIVVAVIDEGVDVNHADLQANMVAGYDAVTADPTPGGIPGNANSTDGHGTCCAGIIAAVGNNGIGVAGVTWNSKIMPIRIGFGNYWTQTDWLVDGLTWPVDNGADILSNSWGGGSASTAIQNAIAYGNTSEEVDWVARYFSHRGMTIPQSPIRLSTRNRSQLALPAPAMNARVHRRAMERPGGGVTRFISRLCRTGPVDHHSRHLR